MDPDRPSSVPERLRFDVVGSSNDVLLRLASQDAAEHTSVIADHQTDARGGSGQWYAPKGGLWLSVLWRPDLDACSAPRLTLAAGWGVREGIRRATGLAAGLKWPNDLVLDGRKVGGVIVEGRVSGHDVEAAAIGVGVNVNNPPQQLPGGLPETATSLQEEARQEITLDRLADAVLKGLREASPLVHEPDELLAKFNSCWTQKGAEVEVDVGYTMLAGRAERVDRDGWLVLDTGEAEHRIDDPTLAKFVRVV